MVVKKLIAIFALAFLLNLIWENLHSWLYAYYEGGVITEWILLRATLFDAIFITLLAIPFLKISYLQNRLWYSIIFGITAAILIEWFALNTGRWAYSDAMPIIPLLKTGLTPTIQLGLLSYLTYKSVMPKI
ncbi:MAG: hypothetical protein A3I24_00360 [Candidatus Harrisonbacteria bacterium RIFCSPLOWO2_02_FULL_41_13b]|uniref:Uncharacterized protein n=1 Tax=Candidatus Harrisonbacteria bacterium RIFCSPLOWO2_02_FULL_41_13b TaxID=1798409 RepID=A0A1G1ZSK0_9BACT|nr:MAG: hypothetical protein A3J53_00380 [Candidatus Harrisonbacteria bacterium RIFCSPHIGHO2_02_FULL_40_20]OGY67532.1 MAG: hypothetical protein A3I24_00360 [Candidatus Harrisonbacteria bacterium RIFCSPLOWO2_02_FULL_41_13b]